MQQAPSRQQSPSGQHEALAAVASPLQNGQSQCAKVAFVLSAI
jgi:hypothetical protein